MVYFYFENNEFINSFIIPIQEPNNDQYINLKKKILFKLENNDYRFSDKILQRKRSTFFEFNWIPSILQGNISNITQVFWKFMKVNLLLRMVHLTKENINQKIGKFISHNMELLVSDMYDIEGGKFRISNSHELINVKMLNDIVESSKANVYYRKNHIVWDYIRHIQNTSTLPNNGSMKNGAIELMKHLNVEKKHIKVIRKKKHKYSFVWACFLLIVERFEAFKVDGEIFPVWEMIPFLNYLCYKTFPKDSVIVNESSSFLKYIPMYEGNVKDRIFDVHDNIESAMNDDLPYTDEKIIDPITFILRISLPRRHIKKNSYNHVMNYYKTFNDVRLMLDSCIVNSIVGLYEGRNEQNLQIFKEIRSIKMLLRFYNDFVFNPNRIKFIKNLCNNQIYLKWIIRDFVIFTIKNNNVFSLEKNFFENVDNTGNKMNLTFSNFVSCNRNNIKKYQWGYFFGVEIKKYEETTKRKKEIDLETTILAEVKQSIQGDFIIKKIFDIPTETYIQRLPSIIQDRFKMIVKFDHIKLHEKLWYCGLEKKDCRIIKKIEKNFAKKNSKMKQQIEKLSVSGKFFCYNFFQYQTKIRKIRFFELNMSERLFQQLINAMMNKSYFETVTYTLCCDYPRICNKAGNQNSNPNESGLNEVSIGVGGKLFCSKHHKKKVEKDNEMILYILKKDIIQEIKKLFLYNKNRILTFQLYQYVFTKKVDLPQWLVNEPDDIFTEKKMIERLKLRDQSYRDNNVDMIGNEDDMDEKIASNALVNFFKFTGLTEDVFKKKRKESGYFEPKTFSLPITTDRVKVKDILIKIITSNKLQIKTVLNKRLKSLINEKVTDTSTLSYNLTGEYIVIETKKRSKKKNKIHKKGKKNDHYYRVFRLCERCGELKLYNKVPMEMNEYMCKDCMGTKKEQKVVMYFCPNDFIPIQFMN